MLGNLIVAMRGKHCPHYRVAASIDISPAAVSLRIGAGSESFTDEEKRKVGECLGFYTVKDLAWLFHDVGMPADVRRPVRGDRHFVSERE